MTAEPWLDTRQTAEGLGLGYQFVRKMAIAGLIPCVEIGFGKRNKTRLFKLSQVNAALDALTQKTA